MANRSAAGFGKVMSVTCLPASSAPAPAPMRPAGDIALNHSLQLLALWSCGRRVSVAQAQRQIHRAHPGRPHRRWSLVTQGLVRPG